MEEVSGQLTLDLDDRHQYLESFMRQNRHRMGSGSSWYVFPARSRALSTNVYYLGLRHNCMAGTDYDYLIRVSREEAEWLVSSSRGRRYEERVHEFCDCLKEK